LVLTKEALAYEKRRNIWFEPFFYAWKVGTSMAAPHASGALALLKAQFPMDSYLQLINRVCASVDVLSSLNLKCQTGGRLNVHQALVTTSSRPRNDNFENPYSISALGAHVRALSTVVNNVDATKQAGEPNHALNAGGRSVWWIYTPDASDASVPVTISTADSYKPLRSALELLDASRPLDTLLAVYTGSSLDTLQLVTQDDDSGGNLASQVTFTPTEGIAYRIAVDGYNGAAGTIKLSLRKNQPVEPRFQIVDMGPGSTGASDPYLNEKGNSYNLNNLIPQGTGWTIVGAESPDQFGQISGWGYLNGEPHLFLLTPSAVKLYALQRNMSTHQFRFKIVGKPGASVNWAYSIDLENWTTFSGTYYLNSTGVYEVTDESVPTGYRFYRVKTDIRYSGNAVGYVDLLFINGYSMVANQLLVADNRVAALFPQVPEGSSLYKWDEVNSLWQTNIYQNGTWSDQIMTLVPGEGALFYNPSPNTRSALIGEVPQGYLVKPIPAVGCIRSSMVPQKGQPVRDLLFPAVYGDIIYRMENGTYLAYTWRGWGWSGGSSQPVINVGESFWVFKNAPADWKRNYAAWP
jgi:hypothetical protein